MEGVSESELDSGMKMIFRYVMMTYIKIVIIML